MLRPDCDEIAHARAGAALRDRPQELAALREADGVEAVLQSWIVGDHLANLDHIFKYRIVFSFLA